MIGSQVNPRIMKTLQQAAEMKPPEMKVILQQVDHRFREDEKTQFASQGTSGGQKWQALSPRYKAWKKRKFPGRKIMSLTGKTRKSLTTKGGGHIAQYDLRPRPSVTVGTSVKTAAYHIRSSNNPLYNPRMPHRDTLQMTRRQERNYFKIIADYFREVKWPRVEKTLASAAWGRAKLGRRSA